jgi:hypothetical protein
VIFIDFTSNSLSSLMDFMEAGCFKVFWWAPQKVQYMA